MTDAAVSFLLENVKQLVTQKFDVVANAEGDLNKLKEELQVMKSFLKDNADKKSKSDLFQSLERKIRRAVYKAEDAIDECISNANAKKASTSLGKALKKIDLAESVKALLPTIEAVFIHAKKQMEAIELPEDVDREAKKKAGDRLRQHGFQIDKTIVGFEDAIEELIGNLKQPSSEQVEAIPIIGMGGLGKTTVASLIFNDPRIQYAFPVRIWVTVSESHDAKDIYTTIIKYFDKKYESGLSETELAQKAREHLKGVVFLLVADDVWTWDAWKAIKLALPRPSSPLLSDKTTSKVLVTSREDRVAFSANPNRDPHRLRFLTDEESWELLQLEVYGKKNAWPKELEGIGSSIAKQCHGLPLALVVVGGILLDKLSDSIPETKREWERISHKVEEHLLKPENKQHGAAMDYIISLSYEKLPYEYIDCFLYLGAFPEDYEISAWKLTRLWVAEGFIQNDSDRSMEEVAEGNLNELIKRNLVMVRKKNTLGEVKRVAVHDMIRQFCKNEAKRLDLLHEIRLPPNQGVFFPSDSDIGEFRRICLHSDVVEFLRKTRPVTSTRSFVCFSKEDINVPVNFLTKIFDQFRLIRVFEGSPLKFPKFSPGLVELIHLRYLTISAGEGFKLLPESISRLWCLETLAITTSSKSFDVKDLSELKRLRHVKTKAAIVLGAKEKSKIRSLFSSGKSDEVNENLQTLTRLSTKSCTSEVLARTPNLKTLGIRGDLDSILETTSLQNLKLVSKLKLKNDADTEKELYRVPSSKFFPPNLTSLTLEATNLEWKHMDQLATLMKLENLKLKDFAFKGEKWSFDSDGFDSLECLHIERSDLTDWEVSENSFIELKYLIIKGCEKLKKVPSGLAMKLKMLDIEHVSKEAVISAVEIREKRGPILKLKIAPGDMKAADIKKKF